MQRRFGVSTGKRGTICILCGGREVVKAVFFFFFPFQLVGTWSFGLVTPEQLSAAPFFSVPKVPISTKLANEDKTGLLYEVY